MKKYLNILRKCPLFFNISDDDLDRMLHCLGAQVVSFDKKYTILAEGSVAKHIGILLTGEAQVVRIDYYGNRSIIENIRSGELFGEAFACAEAESSPVGVVALEPSDVMLIDCSHILHTCSNNCEFHQRMIFNLMKNLATKTLSFHQKLEIISKRTTREKLLAFLSICAKREGSYSFEIPFDRQELADYLEVDRSGLSAEISKLRSEGLLETTKKHFELF